jgi:hypothetical protein
MYIFLLASVAFEPSAYMSFQRHSAYTRRQKYAYAHRYTPMDMDFSDTHGYDVQR